MENNTAAPRIVSNGLYATQQAAKLLGLSDSQFRRLAKRLTPAGSYVNPHYRSGPPCPLYLGSDIRKLKNRIRKSAESFNGRRVAAAKAVATKRMRIKQYVESVVISIPEFDKDELIARSCENYNRLQTDFLASSRSDEDFLSRITVNYLRHCCTRYEHELRAIAGKTGCREAYRSLKCRILDAIAEAYPDLSPECIRQSGPAVFDSR